MNTIDIIGVIGWDVTAYSVKRALAEVGEVDSLKVNLSSPGGYVDDGFDIYALLKNHPAHITFNITSMAYSMGSVIVQAGDVVTMEDTAMLMVHKPSGLVWGNADDMRDEAVTLDKYESRLIKAYNRRDALKLSKKQLKEAISETTWYTSDEALAAGFVDKIIDGKDQDEIPEISDSAINWLRVAGYKGTPNQITQHIESNGGDLTPFNPFKVQPFINKTGGNSAANPKEDDSKMSKYTEAEFENGVAKAVKTALEDADKKINTAGEAAVKTARADVLERLEKLSEHENASNTAAMVRIAKLDIPLDDAMAYMDDVQPLTGGASNQNRLSKEEEDRIASEAAKRAVAEARAAASDTTHIESGVGGSTSGKDAEALEQERIKADNERRGA